MNILYLGNSDSPLVEFLKNDKNDVKVSLDALKLEEVKQDHFDFLISYSYRHIIKKEILDLFPNRAINLHISFLPWNRGADPNIWSFVENSPKGVTIHHLDEGVDTGDIIAQREIKFDENSDTLKTSYDKLHQSIQNLFFEIWPSLKAGIAPRKKQSGDGSIHKMSDKKKISALIEKLGFETPIKNLIKKS